MTPDIPVPSPAASLASTSAAGAMLVRRVSEPILLVGLALSSLGTSPGADIHLIVPGWMDPTTAGGSVPASGDAAGVAGAATALAELRRRSGLTWDQLGRLLNVSRRTVHLWASGKPMTKPNEEHLQQVLAVIRGLDRGAAAANRQLLVSPLEGGKTPIDLLAEGDYPRVSTELGRGPEARPSATRPQLSQEARAARAPRPPEELVGALQDRVGPKSGRLLRSKPIVTSRRK